MTTDSEILAGLRDAILTEHTGSSFYTIAAENTEDPKGREVFRMLAAEEDLHEQYLKKQYALIAEGRDPDPLVVSDTAALLEGDSPVFSTGLRDRIADAHREMTALSVGLQLELHTIARYRELAELAGRPGLREFYDKLRVWEEGHARALERQSRLLREAYWDAGGFAPF